MITSNIGSCPHQDGGACNFGSGGGLVLTLITGDLTKVGNGQSGCSSSRGSWARQNSLPPEVCGAVLPR